jgi:cytochrome P450
MPTDTLAQRPAPTIPPLRRIADLPGPPGNPLLGNALQIEPARLHRQMAAWTKQHGPYCQMQFGRLRTPVISDRKVVAQMLRDRPDGFGRSARLSEITAEMGIPTGGYSADGDDWQRKRRMVMHGFDPAHIRRNIPALRGVAQRW